METLTKDIRYALRQLLNHRAFSLIAILALALGIGANTAIFSVVNAVLLRPLPYPAPEQLVWLWGTNPLNDIPKETASYPDYADWRQQNPDHGMRVPADQNSPSLTTYAHTTL